jgi:hypothetical protein
MMDGDDCGTVSGMNKKNLGHFIEGVQDRLKLSQIMFFNEY